MVKSGSWLFGIVIHPLKWFDLLKKVIFHFANCKGLPEGNPGLTQGAGAATSLGKEVGKSD